MQTIFFIILFLVFFILIISIFIFYENRRKSEWIEKRLLSFVPKKGKTETASRGLGLIIAMGRRVSPRDERIRILIKKQLSYAGYIVGFAPELYFGIRIILCAGLSLVFISYTIFLGKLGLQTLYGAFILTIVGYYMPLIFIKTRIKARNKNIFRELPDTLDLLVLCVEAGLGFEMALLRVSKELKNVAPILSREFTQYFFETRSGVARNEALENMKERNGSPGLKAVVDVALQSIRFGTDIAPALRVHSDFMRSERQQIAEEQGAKIAVKLTLPLVFLVLPALLIVILGPAIMRLVGYFSG